MQKKILSAFRSLQTDMLVYINYGESIIFYSQIDKWVKEERFGWIVWLRCQRKKKMSKKETKEEEIEYFCPGKVRIGIISLWRMIQREVLTHPFLQGSVWYYKLLHLSTNGGVSPQEPSMLSYMRKIAVTLKRKMSLFLLMCRKENSRYVYSYIMVNLESLVLIEKGHIWWNIWSIYENAQKDLGRHICFTAILSPSHSGDDFSVNGNIFCLINSPSYLRVHFSAI